MAHALAGRSERVAAALRAGDECTADREADRLRAAAIAAVNERRVPPPYQEELLANVNQLAERVLCRPPPAVEPAPTPAPPAADEDVDENDDERRGRGKGNGKRRDKGEKPDRD